MSQLEKQWHVLRAFLWLVAFYAVLHRGVVPFVLKFTRLAGTGYAHVDLWFLHPLLLAFLIKPKDQMTPTTSLLAGAGISQGVFELRSALTGAVAGWSLISHLLSALPFAIICILFLSGGYPGTRAASAWAGAIAFLALRLLWARWYP